MAIKMLLIAVIMILLILLLAYKISALSLIMWMVEEDLPQPSEADMNRLTKKVVANIWKDITGGWSKKP